ncbi:hypothetical protein ACM16X_04245 [Haloarcula japonica]|uniref:hypothetical protein n=1 Tax=Haloarcula japonica TaxID=29282 RepID=UPI0039F7126A
MSEDSRQDDDLPHLDGVTEADDSGRGRNRTIRNSDIAAYFSQHDAVHDPEVSDPVLKSSDVAQEVDLVTRTVRNRLNELEEKDVLSKKEVGSGTVWWVTSENLAAESFSDKVDAVVDTFVQDSAVYEPSTSAPVLSTAEVSDYTGLSSRQVRERLSEMVGNLELRHKTAGSATVWWLVTSTDPTQPSLGDFDLTE